MKKYQSSPKKQKKLPHDKIVKKYLWDKLAPHGRIAICVIAGIFFYESLMGWLQIFGIPK